MGPSPGLQGSRVVAMKSLLGQILGKVARAAQKPAGPAILKERLACRLSADQAPGPGEKRVRMGIRLSSSPLETALALTR